MSISVSGGGAVAAPIGLTGSNDIPWLTVSAPTTGTDYGYRGKRGRWAMGFSSPVAQPGGDRGDVTWYFGYGLNETGQNGQGLASDLVDQDELGFFFRYEDYYERGTPYSTGTISAATWDAATGCTTLTGTGTTFPSDVASSGFRSIRFTATGTRYEIVTYTNGTSIAVRGDATAESGAYVISEEFAEWHMGSLADSKMPYLDGRQNADDFVTRRLWNCQIVRGHPWVTLDLMADQFAITGTPTSNGTDETMLFLRSGKGLYCKGMTWTASSKTLTATGMFTALNFRKSASKIRIISGTGATLGTYTIDSKTSANAIVLVTSLAAGDLATGDIVGVIDNATLGECRIPNASIQLSNSCYIQGMGGSGNNHNMIGMNVNTSDILILGTSTMGRVSIGPPLIDSSGTGLKFSNDATNGLILGTATNKTIGFFNSAGTTKQTITGSRGGNAALASLLTALAAHSLITDSTTA